MKNHFWSTLVLSVLLGIVGAMFTVPGYDEVIPHPQFDQFDQTEQVIAMIRATDKNTLSTNGLLWFKCFFIIDFIWAACLLTFLYRWIRLKSKGEDAAGRKSQLILILLLIFSVPAYALDVLENINYLLLLSSSKAGWLSTLVDLKVIFYSLVFIMAVCI
jgi:hypothetical protein